jgi:diadenylate cyclase
MSALDWLLSLVRPVDVVEIVLVAVLLYRLYRLMRGTIAVQIALGLMAVLVVQALVAWADMTILQALFAAISDVFVLALVILFQPELRRLLVVVGQTPLIRRFVAGPGSRTETVEALAEGAEALSKSYTGGLIAVERTAGLRQYIETGTRLGARLDPDLLVSLFYGENPLHDGAVIVRGTTIEAARCILPVTAQELDPHLGLRHRAAVGLSEQTDAVVLVVSEQTGTISMAEAGRLRRIPGGAALRRALAEALGLTTPAEGDALPPRAPEAAETAPPVGVEGRDA